MITLLLHVLRLLLSFAKTMAGKQAVDLPVLIQTQSRLDDHSPAPPASTLPLLLRRPPPARGREPCPAAAARRVQKNDGPTPSCARRIASFGSGRFPERLRAVLSPARP